MALCPSWAVILAGGEGSRLRPLTRMISGDDRPKQFCRLTSSRSLLSDTMARVAEVVDPDRTLYLVSRHHEMFYRHDLGMMRPSHILQQPASRGTTAAVACAVASIQARAGRAAQAIVGFFPADHFCADLVALRRALETAYATTAQHPDRVVIIGAAATRPETDYGWIQPGVLLEPERPARRASAVREVIGFWEKPPADAAADLLAQHWLWNTFLSVGRVDAFAALLADTAPDVWSRFEGLRDIDDEHERPAAIEAIYADLASSDFSRDVLASRPDRLAVVELPAAAGWTDLGQPGRVLDVMARHHLPRTALRWAAS